MEEVEMKSLRGIFLVSMLIVVVGFAVVIYMMFWGPDHIETAGRSLKELFKDGDIMPIIIVPIMLVIMFFSIRPLFRIIFPAEIKDGVTTQAKVLKVWDTGVSINDNPQVGLLLEFSLVGGALQQVETKTVVSRLNVALVQPGITAEIKVDPNDFKRLKVLSLDIEQPPAEDAVSRMEELTALRDRKLITEDEYQRKREEILKSI
jgi:hypothetical protein